MPLEAALSNAAQIEPNTTVATRLRSTRRSGSGLCADPHAVKAPAMTPSSGGKRVNGLVNARNVRQRDSGLADPDFVAGPSPRVSEGFKASSPSVGEAPAPPALPPVC